MKSSIQQPMTVTDQQVAYKKKKLGRIQDSHYRWNRNHDLISSRKQCFGSGSAWIRIKICLLDPDPGGKKA